MYTCISPSLSSKVHKSKHASDTCVRVYIYVYMHTHLSLSLIKVPPCMSLSLIKSPPEQAHVVRRMCACTRMCMNICMCTYIHIYVCMYISLSLSLIKDSPCVSLSQTKVHMSKHASSDACVCVCICVCIHVCIYIRTCMDVYTYICIIYACISLSLTAGPQEQARVVGFMCVCVCACICVCIYICMYICIYVLCLHVHLSRSSKVRKDKHASNICVHVCIHVYMYTRVSLSLSKGPPRMSLSLSKGPQEQARIIGSRHRRPPVTRHRYIHDCI